MPGLPQIAILGAGPGGYVAAIRGAQLGARVTVIESQALGGVCLNWGCIPSKALLGVVERGDKVKKADAMGLRVGGSVTYDLAQMVARKDQVVAGLVKGIATLFKAWNIEYVEGRGILRDRQEVHVELRHGGDRCITADSVIVGTGSSWWNLLQFPIDGRQILTSQQLLDLTVIPRQLLIIGGGVEGCEFAALYSGLGTHVTIVELMEPVLPLEDEDVSSTMARELKKRNVTVITGTTVERLERQTAAVTAQLKDGQIIETEVVLDSVGRGLNSRGIGLEQLGVQTGRRGEIRRQRAHASVSARHLCDWRRHRQGDVGARRLGARQGRRGTYSRPPDVHAVRRGEYGRFRYTALGKAQATGETTGFCKIIADAPSGKILGVHIVGAHAADLIHEAALAMQLGATVSQLAGMIHAHSTVAEGMMEAAEDVEDKAIHQLKKKVG